MAFENEKMVTDEGLIVDLAPDMAIWEMEIGCPAKGWPL